MNHEDDFFKTRKSIQEKRIHTFSTTVKYYLAVLDHSVSVTNSYK